jgi:hypothetical protein
MDNCVTALDETHECVTFSQDEQNTADAITEDDKRYFLPAISETLASNFLLSSVYFLAGPTLAPLLGIDPEFAVYSPDMIADHFTHPLVWDRDGTFPNMGHLLQGITYHAAARSNGFTFYEALAFDVFGSLTWELFGENTTPSVNDLIRTTTSGAAWGEMVHRLYLETRSPAAFLISPVDAINGSLTGRRPERGRKNLYGITLRTGAEYELLTVTDHHTGGNVSVLGDRRHAGAVNLETHVIYGNPFEQESKIPYNHFELTLGGSIGLPWYYNVKMFSDGYLFSFSTVNEEKKKISTGLSLHSDVFAGSLINQSNEALDWTIKYQRTFDNDMRVELKAHAGWSVLSSADFYILEGNNRSKNAYRAYGTGVNVKMFLSLFFPKGSIFSADIMLYRMYAFFHEVQIPNTTVKTPGIANGLDACNIFEVSYRYPLTKSFFIGISDTFAGKFGAPDQFTTIGLWSNTARLFVEWSF